MNNPTKSFVDRVTDSSRPVPTPNRIVEYVLPDGPHAGESRPALIVKVHGKGPEATINVWVFGDGKNDGQTYSGGPVWETSVLYSADPTKYRTWHWPVMAPVTSRV